MSPHEQPTPQYVRNLLIGQADLLDIPLANLTQDQRMALALTRIAEDLDRLNVYGCQQRDEDIKRIAKLEDFVKAFRVGVYVLAATGAVLIFAFAVAPHIR